MPKPTERVLTILTGLAVSVFFTGVSVVAVMYSAGTFDDVYTVTARFDAAGQGLIRHSNVKVRGVDIGEVQSVELDDSGQALVRLRIEGDQKIPANARAVVRPKTLFGEKFVDIETTPEGEAKGPYLGDGDDIRDTVGSFELEKVLVGADRLLRAVEPQDLAVVLDTLAEASRGQGEAIRRQVENWRKVADVFAAHDADTRQFLDDFEILAGAFAQSGDDVTALSRNLNQLLPKLNVQADDLDNLLDDVADLSRDLADVFERARPTLEKLVTEGGKTLAVAHENRQQVPLLVVALRDFTKVLSQAVLYEGTYSQWSDAKGAHIKLVADQTTLVFLACSVSETDPACTLGKALLGLDTGETTGAGSAGSPGRVVGGPPVTSGSTAVADLVGQMLAGIPAAALVEFPS